jgi:hypothetical protein
MRALSLSPGGNSDPGHPAVHRDTCAFHALAMARSRLGPDLDPHSGVTRASSSTSGARRSRSRRGSATTRPRFSMAVYGHLMDRGIGEGLHLTPPVVAA